MTKKETELQARLREAVYPDAQNEGRFAALSRMLRDMVIGTLPSGISITEHSWVYDTHNEEWSFKAAHDLDVEVKSPIPSKQTRRCVAEAEFTLPIGMLKPDLKLALELLIQDIEAWKNALQELRKLQLRHVLANQGEAAYLAALDRAS